MLYTVNIVILMQTLIILGVYCSFLNFHVDILSGAIFLPPDEHPFIYLRSGLLSTELSVFMWKSHFFLLLIWVIYKILIYFICFLYFGWFFAFFTFLKLAFFYFLTSTVTCHYFCLFPMASFKILLLFWSSPALIWHAYIWLFLLLILLGVHGVP